MNMQTKEVIHSLILILTSAVIANSILDGLLSNIGIWHLLAIGISIVIYQNIYQDSRFSNLSTVFGVFIGLRFTAITTTEEWLFGDQTSVLDSIDAGWITYTSAPVAGIFVFLLIQALFQEVKINEESE